MAGASARRRVRDTSSRCVVESVTGTHDLVVANYSLLDGHVSPGVYVSSSTFTVGGCDWRLRFFPHGISAPSTSTSVFLHLCPDPKPAGGVMAKFTVRLVNRNGNASLLWRCKAATITFSAASPHGDSRGWRFFFWKPLLRLSGCLVSDCLTIRCVLTVIGRLPTEDMTTPAVKKVPPPELFGHLERSLKEKRGADVAFDVGGREFSAHRFMLAVRSPVFEAQLFGPTMEKDMEPIKTVDIEPIKIVDMEPAIFEMLLHYIYTDTLPPCNGGGGHDVPAMQQLLVAADRYGLHRLKLMCEKKLSKARVEV